MHYKIKNIFTVICFLAAFIDTKAAVREDLREILDRIKTDKQYCKKLRIREPQLIEAFYSNNNYRLQWYKGKGDTRKRQDFFAIITSRKFMTDPSDYQQAVFLNKKMHTRKDSILAEIKMTDLALYFFKDVAYSHNNFIKNNLLHYQPDCLDIGWLLQQSLETGDWEKYILESEPESESYLALKDLYLKLYDSSNRSTNKKNKISAINRLAKIQNAAGFYRWISCIQFKSCIVINLASKNLSYTECGKDIFTCGIYPGNIPSNSLPLVTAFKNITFYYDALYPSNLEFNFGNSLQLAICSLKKFGGNEKRLNCIGVEKPDELAVILGIDTAKIQNNVCLDEATPFTEIPVKHIPVIIVNIPLDFNK